MNKAQELKKALSYCVQSIKQFKVSADNYRRYVDMDYTGTNEVDVVEIEYTPDCYALPHIMTAAHFHATPLDTLIDEVAI